MKISKIYIKKTILLLISIILMLGFYKVFLDLDKKVVFNIFEAGNEERVLSSNNVLEQTFKVSNNEIESINLYPAEEQKFEQYSFHYQIFNRNVLLVESDINLQEVSRDAPISIVLPTKIKNIKNEELKIILSTNNDENLSLKSDNLNRLSLSVLSSTNIEIVQAFKNIFIFLIGFLCLIFIFLFFSTISYKVIFVVSLIVAGMIMNFLIPVGNVPDEANAHIITVYHYSNQLVGVNDDPANVKIRKCDDGLFHYAYINSDKIVTYLNDMKIKNVDSSMIESHQGILVTKGYSFTYLLSTLGFTVGRILNFNGILCVLIGRLFNYIFFVLCSYLALSKIKAGKKLLALFCFLPMTIQQTCSLSYDSNVISLGIIIFALSVNLFYNKLSKKEFLLLIASSILLIPCKSLAYVPLLLIPISYYFKDFSIRRIMKKINSKWIYFIILLLIILLFLVLTLLRKSVAVSSILYPILHPSLFIKVMSQTLYSELNGMFNSFIGNPLGLLDINIYAPLLFVYTSFITVVILSTKINITNRIRYVWIFAFAFSFIGILFAMYSWSYSLGFIDLTTTFVIRGFQGRYMLPLALPLAAALSSCKNNHYVSIQSVIYMNMFLLYFVFASIMIFLV